MREFNERLLEHIPNCIHQYVTDFGELPQAIYISKDFNQNLLDYYKERGYTDATKHPLTADYGIKIKIGKPS